MSENLENNIEETVEETINQQEQQQTEETIDNEGPVKSIDEDGTIKLDFSKTQQDAVQEQETDAMDVDQRTEDSRPVAEEVRTSENDEESVQNEEQSILEEIIENETVEETAAVENKAEELANDVEQALSDQKSSGIELPENIQKVVEFINETGGSLEDYVRLNQDYSSLPEQQLLKEYYKATKPHLDDDEIDFLMGEDFSYDEELDDETDVRKKKIAKKEALNKAKLYLDSLKDKYYDEIKAGSKLTPEQQKAVDFFNRYNEEQQGYQKQADVFKNRTEKVFGQDFKGFDYSVGDKKYRFKVKNPNEVKQSQSDINNFVKKFLGEDNTIKDAKGYHKALFTAMNADAIANHFYEQGKADAIKDSVARSKNIDMKPRQGHEAVTNINGLKVRAVSGEDSSRLRVKIKQ